MEATMRIDYLMTLYETSPFHSPFFKNSKKHQDCEDKVPIIYTTYRKAIAIDLVPVLGNPAQITFIPAPCLLRKKILHLNFSF